MASPGSPASGHRLVARPIFSFGLVAAVFGLGFLHARLLAPVQVDFFSSEVSLWWAVLATLLVVISYAVGLPELATSRWSAVLRGLAATVAAFAVMSGLMAMLARPLLPRSSSALVGIVVPVWALIAWNLAQDASARAATKARVFVVTERREDLVSLQADVAEGAEAPATVVGYLPLADIVAAGDTSSGLLVDEATEAAATILVLDAAAQAAVSAVEQAAELHRRGVHIRTFSLFYEEWIGKLPHSELARVSLLFDVGELHRIRYVRFKRVLDVSFALAGSVALGPLMLAVAVLNPMLNPGPLLYRQSRVGKDGEPFTILKLRTMTPSTDGDSRWTMEGDARVTPLGGFLRRTHLDELPQVINILRGDISLIGPRPEQPHYVEELAEKIAFYELRHIVRPGLTGWAQVKQGYASDHNDAFDKLQYDFYYLRRQGVGLDARILWRTVRGVIGGAGR